MVIVIRNLVREVQIWLANTIEAADAWWDAWLRRNLIRLVASVYIFSFVIIAAGQIFLMVQTSRLHAQVLILNSVSDQLRIDIMTNAERINAVSDEQRWIREQRR